MREGLLLSSCFRGEEAEGQKPSVMSKISESVNDGQLHTGLYAWKPCHVPTLFDPGHAPFHHSDAQESPQGPVLGVKRSPKPLCVSTNSWRHWVLAGTTAKTPNTDSAFLSESNKAGTETILGLSYAPRPTSRKQRR